MSRRSFSLTADALPPAEPSVRGAWRSAPTTSRTCRKGHDRFIILPEFAAIQSWGRHLNHSLKVSKDINPNGRTIETGSRCVALQTSSSLARNVRHGPPRENARHGLWHVLPAPRVGLVAVM